MALKNIVLRFPELAYSLQNTMLVRNLSKIMSIEGHTDEITGICKVKDFWVSVSLDKTVRFIRVNWDEEKFTKEYEVVHKKKITSICGNDDAVFIGDKTGEVWRIVLGGLQSGGVDNLDCCSFYIGHQASIEKLWCYNSYLISSDCEWKIKVTQIQSYGIIESILLGHTSKIVSSLLQKGELLSCDESGVLKFWDSHRELASMKLNEPIDLYLFGEHILGISKTQTFYIDQKLKQVIPIHTAPVCVDYPHASLINPESFTEIKLNFPQ
ncbi:hypothetical protein SteCoe_30315 [Stentor coeruleus]|uniref:Uncharacterized protein n=1 Tax=Stentor coeruleus TaxID=5963 RepID=A0A1R2B400_9CILI|nr:hypothetical protein SteCoe_30315 [Stentor coeruleus]